jgi:hypothetical protein
VCTGARWCQGYGNYCDMSTVVLAPRPRATWPLGVYSYELGGALLCTGTVRLSRLRF